MLDRRFSKGALFEEKRRSARKSSCKEILNNSISHGISELRYQACIEIFFGTETV
jgi:hypothetical protein